MTIVFVFVTYHDIVALLLLPAAFHCFESWACDDVNADDDDCVYDGIKKNVKVEAIAIAIFKFGS